MAGRIFTNIAAIAGIAGLALTWSAAAQAQEFGSPELIAAAKAEGLSGTTSVLLLGGGWLSAGLVCGLRF